MSFEDEKKRHRQSKPSSLNDSIKGIVFGTAVLGAGAITAGVEMRKALDEINSHVLTPAIIEIMRSEAGASDSEIADLEALLRTQLLQELKRLRERK